MYRALCKAKKEYVAVVFLYVNKECTSGRLISRKQNRKGLSVLQNCVMKILEAAVATAKFIYLILIFLMNRHNKNFFFQVCLHLKLCMCRAVQYWCWNFDTAAILVEFHSYILLLILTFIGRRSWWNIGLGEEIGSFQRAWNTRSNNKGAF